MSFDWLDYLDIAKYLHLNSINFGKNKQEAAYRAAVSRAYYSAYCHIRNYAIKNTNFTPTGKGADHRLIRDHLKNHEMISIANRLDTLHIWRKKCDYDDKVNNIDKIVIDAIKTADNAINDLNQE